MISHRTESGSVFLIDDMHPEDVAMLQALYSRSPESVESHALKVADAGSGRFMERYYVGYGHRSIGDGGSTTLFFQDVSILAAKAIQDSPLYSGQETSTRYLDFSKRRVVDPVGTAESRAIIDRWMNFYREAQEPTACEVARRHPRRAGEDEGTYERAVRARAFDILRGFLPAGATTQLSLHTNLRQAADALDRLDRHPLAEARELSKGARRLLEHRYASSFRRGSAADGDVARWEEKIASRILHEPAWAGSEIHASCRAVDSTIDSTIDSARLRRFEDLLSTRPRGALLPHALNALGQISFGLMLDYGSWRDVQRHRSGVCVVPVLAPLLFEPWYLEQLDPVMRIRAERLLDEQRRAIRALGCSDEEAQYYTALGFRVPTRLVYGLPGAVYMLELRSSKSVHPTLRREVLRMVEALERAHPEVLIHADREPDGWTVRRGGQTIVERTA